jgi:hypothetical protein
MLIHDKSFVTCTAISLAGETNLGDQFFKCRLGLKLVNQAF